MTVLSATDITLSFGTRKILDRVSFSLDEHDKIGLIGVNGCGKSTLFKIITGELESDEGQIFLSREKTVGILRQDSAFTVDDTLGDNALEQMYGAFPELLAAEQRLFELQEKMASGAELHVARAFEEENARFIRDGGLEFRGRCASILSKMGFDEESMRRPLSTLSGGQRTRLALARQLSREPDILLLDEPTNYLDAEHIEWLKRYLNEYENAFILISHDIPFLNSVINLIYHMDNRQLNRYVGDYDKFKEVYEMKKSQLEAAYNRQQKEIAELKDFVARNKANVATRNMAMSRQKKLDKMDVIELAKEKPKPEFRFKTARTPGRILFSTKDLVIGYDEPLSAKLNVSMERGEKIVMTGANGIGKSTLLRSILGLIKPLEGSVELGDYLEIGYFEQETPAGIETTCLEEIWQEFPSFTQYEVRSALAKCGLTTKHIESRVKVLSGGEQAKVRLCKLINRESNLLVLDEPTNHLDVDAKDELKRALSEYKGSILMVCHEPEFYEGLATNVWDCSKWTTRAV